MSDTLPTYGASASLTAYYSPGGDNGQSTSYGFAPPYPVALPAMAYVEDGGGASATASASVGTTPEVTASAEASELPAQDNGIVDGDAVVSVQSELTFSFEIAGPKTEAVPIDYVGGATDAISTSAGSGAYVNETNLKADGYIQLGNLSGPTVLAYTSSGTGVVTLETNTVYVAVLQVFGGVDEAYTPTVLEVSGSASMALSIDPSFAGASDFSIEYSPGLACYCEGTRILTERGALAVEVLHIGDHVVTLSGALRPVRWIGHRRLDLGRHPAATDACPIRFAAGALGTNLPERDLLVSPDHALLVGGRLLPARLLLNGATITSENRMRHVTYFHVELDSHDILLAEGVPAESYLDTGNRGAFENAGTQARLYPDFAGDKRLREALSCLTLTTAPGDVEPIWRNVAARAEALGWSLPCPPETVDDPDLHIMVEGRRFDPVVSSDGRVVFVVPGSHQSLRLASRAARPSELQAWHDDRRLLGMQVRGLTLRERRDVTEIPMDHPMLPEGWWAAEQDDQGLCRWTNGKAVLPAMGHGLIVLQLGRGMRYPAHAGMEPQEAKRKAA